MVNDTEVVLVEVKSKLTQKDVDQHLQRLDKFNATLLEYESIGGRSGDGCNRLGSQLCL